jgi:NAD(P)-dependent dehydrogenase (short-subunit alcohol dehydrogenase family)
VSSRKKADCESAAAELSKLGSCEALPADLSTDAECRRLASEIEAREGALHILVNNAGANWGAPYAEYPDVAFDKVLALNVKAIFNLTRALTPRPAPRSRATGASSTSARSTAPRCRGSDLRVLVQQGWRDSPD